MTRQADPRAGRRSGALGRLAGEGFRMGVISAGSLVLGYALTVALHEGLGMPAEWAYALAVLTCSVLNFFGARHYVFRGRKGPLFLEATKFFPSILLFRAMEIVLFSTLNRLLDNYHFAYLSTTAISAMAKFLVSRMFIFKRHD